jgi:23S rRNA pseudouridine1911/1915/1917 synthase
MSSELPSDSRSEEREKIRITVPAGERRKRIDVYLTHRIENATRNKVHHAIEAGLVCVNGKPAKPSYQVNPGDILDITMPRPPRPEAKPEDIPLNILFEDDSFLIVNKSAGMVTHPAFGNYTGTAFFA